MISSQGVHDRYGGVVPEIASRHHLELVGARRRRRAERADVSLGSLDLVAVTPGPGLVAALLVGSRRPRESRLRTRCRWPPWTTCTATSRRAFSRPTPFEPPFLSLIASGGHTLLARVTDHGPAYEVLGQTLDDAAGEAFDKGARLLGLGYPGGPALERLARDGDPEAFAFPTGARVRGLDFSFAGLKTALLYRVRDLGEAEAERRRADLAASYQRAIVEALACRVERALAQTGLERLAVGGGVAANGPLRERLCAAGG